MQNKLSTDPPHPAQDIGKSGFPIFFKWGRNRHLKKENKGGRLKIQENTMCFEVSSNRPPAKPEIHNKIKKTQYFCQYCFGSRDVDTTSGRTMCKKRRFFNCFQRSLIRNIRFFRVFRCRFPRAPPPGTRQLCLIKRSKLARHTF